MAFDQIPAADDVINKADLATDLVGKYVVSPVAALGIAGFVFDIARDHKIEKTADITDHYVEKNSAVQDHIAKKPDIITLSGYVGEVVYRVTPEASKLQSLAKKAITIAGFLPVLTSAAKSIQDNIANRDQGAQGVLDASLGTGIDLYQTFKKLNPPKTAQAKAFNYFEAMFEARTLVSLDTPYGFRTTMAIQNIIALQDENSQYMSDFIVVLKKVNQVTTKTVKFDPNKYKGRVKAQASDTDNQGKMGAKNVKEKPSFSSVIGDSLKKLANLI